jgi:ATP phosphoribosyltransferase
MTGKLIIAVPSKGRLQENTMAFFARAGLHLSQEGGIEILFLSASEIVAKLESGDTHFGVTGEDLIREAVADADRKITLLSPLGFGHANVVVAVPKGWIDASTMEDLEEIAADFHSKHNRRMRVATKYVNLTRRFFAEHGVADYRIVESLGATEGAPSSGTAEFIVDITTTGSTLEANALKVLDDGVMLKSQANLAASRQADWSADTLDLARNVLGRLSAEHAARTTRELRITAPVSMLKDLATLATDEGAQISSGIAASPLFITVNADRAAHLSSRLVDAGADYISVVKQDYVFASRSPLFDRLEASLALTA